MFRDGSRPPSGILFLFRPAVTSILLGHSPVRQTLRASADIYHGPDDVSPVPGFSSRATGSAHSGLFTMCHSSPGSAGIADSGAGVPSRKSPTEDSRR